jgi:zinc transporter ZupT
MFISFPPISVLNLNTQGASKAVVIAAIWTGLVHVIVGVVGTFILKRFPTNFAVGFFLGILLIVSNQNLILFGTFHGYRYGTAATNHSFGFLGVSLFLVLGVFSALLYHFKKFVIVAPIDAKGIGRREESQSYQQYEDQ